MIVLYVVYVRILILFSNNEIKIVAVS